jgi:hypothetical protein
MFKKIKKSCILVIHRDSRGQFTEFLQRILEFLVVSFQFLPLFGCLSRRYSAPPPQGFATHSLGIDAVSCLLHIAPVVEVRRRAT